MSTSQFVEKLRLMGLTDGSGNLISSTAGALNVYLTGGGTTPGTADKSTFAYGTTLQQTVGGVYQDTSPTLTAGQAGAVRLTAYRGQHSNLRDSSGNELLGSKVSASSIPVVIASDQAALPLPTGAATAALQTTGNTSLATIATNTTNAGTPVVSGTVTANQGTPGVGAWPVLAAQSGTWTVSLPTGASTSALQTTGNTSLSSIDSKIPSNLTVTSTRLLVDGSGVTQPVSVASLPLPTGAATSANQATEITSLATIATTQGSSTGGTAGTKSNLTGGIYNTSLPTLTNGQQAAFQQDSTGRLLTSIISAGTAIGNAPIQNLYGSVNVTTSAYVQLVASTSNVINNLHIFDSSGQSMILAIGAAASEVDKLYVPPGGDNYMFTIPAGSRISYKALSANATSGYLLMSFLQ